MFEFVGIIYEIRWVIAHLAVPVANTLASALRSEMEGRAGGDYAWVGDVECRIESGCAALGAMVVVVRVCAREGDAYEVGDGVS